LASAVAMCVVVLAKSNRLISKYLGSPRDLSADARTRMPPLPVAFYELRGDGIISRTARDPDEQIMKRSGRDVPSIVLGLLLGLLIFLALYVFMILGFTPTARPPVL
jgi:hypothetical protein